MNAVIIDMDGTLFDGASLRAQASREILDRLGIEADDGFLDRFAGVTDREMWAEILDERRVSADLAEVLNASLSMQLKLLKKSLLEPSGGAIPFLAELYRKHIPVTVTSPSPGILIKETLKKLGVSRYIRDWVSAESVPKGLPEQDLFLKAAERLELPPDQCVAVVASADGVLASRRAGMKCVGVRAPLPGRGDAGKADLVACSLAEVTIDALKKL